MRVEQLINEPVLSNHPIGTDSAWSMKLKLCMDAVARKFSNRSAFGQNRCSGYESDDMREHAFYGSKRPAANWKFVRKPCRRARI